jgi:iron complex transport system ATP-binding protein
VSARAEGLRFEGVAKKLGGRAVLAGVDLEARAGEVLGLLGPNGAGKTTLLRIATRIVAPDAGRALVAGQDVASLSRGELARTVAVVPQDTQVPFPFRVSEVVLMGRAPHLGLLGFESRQDVARAEAALARVGIEALAGRSLGELSGGERQLVTVARALAQDPRVLLLDEPTAFLDLRHRVEVLEILRGLAAEGRAVLVVSHDLGLAAGFCDRLALLSAGRVAAVGPPTDVLRPDALRAVFGIEADVLPGPGGAPVVVPRGARPQASR